ncbi:MAG: hypothetical protein JWL75_382 [Parcubacteria group bacterium]|nr:hypothetical protein [Parcubacteria group bacterium]
MTATIFARTLAWAKRNERWLSLAFFIFGFVDHIVTFGVFSLPIELVIFEVYLGFAALCMVFAHLAAARPGGKVMNAVAIIAPLFAQLTIGGLLAGFVVFYTKSSVLSVSWPFLILLAFIFFGNELFRDYREHLVFQTTLLYFSLYSLAIFALPVYLGALSEKIFIESTVLSVLVFAAFLGLLAMLGWERLRSTLKHIVVCCIALTVAIVTAYFTDVIPPLPLTLTDGGVYHSITHEGNAYVVLGETPKHWYDPRKEVVHHVPGTPLYAYSAIFAPGAFSTSVVHEWQRYDDSTSAWVTKSTVAFTLSGGREAGYRGYSLTSDPEPGTWRVLVKTFNGQTIGKFDFKVVNVSADPALHEESL